VVLGKEKYGCVVEWGWHLREDCGPGLLPLHRLMQAKRQADDNDRD
jgi:hypothetical protein